MLLNFYLENGIKNLTTNLKRTVAFTDNRIAVTFEYEFRNLAVQWIRAYGNENWEFNEYRLMQRRFAQITMLKLAKVSVAYKRILNRAGYQTTLLN